MSLFRIVVIVVKLAEGVKSERNIVAEKLQRKVDLLQKNCNIDSMNFYEAIVKAAESRQEIIVGGLLGGVYFETITPNNMRRTWQVTPKKAAKGRRG